MREGDPHRSTTGKGSSASLMEDKDGRKQEGRQEKAKNEERR